MISTVLHASGDIKLLWGSVFLRLFAYGSTNLVLLLFLRAIDVSEKWIGVFMTCTLVGDTMLSWGLTWFADALGRRSVLVLGGVLMVVAGLLFTFSTNYWVLLAGAIFGVISPSGDDVGPFKSIEESIMAHLTDYKHRSDIYACHSLLGTLGAALGSLVTGLMVTHLQQQYHWDVLDCYRFVFAVYTGVAVLKLAIMCCLSKECEKVFGAESERLVESEPPAASASTSKLSRDTVRVMAKLLGVFMLDSLGCGFLGAGWIIYYFKTYFHTTASVLGVLFFFTNMSNSLSAIPSALLTKLLGPIRATLLVQIPSGLFLILIPLVTQFPVVALLTVLYYSTSAMDVIPRQVLLTAIITPRDLTKVMGMVNIGKTFARCIGPIITGRLASNGYLWLCFIINGVLVVCSDLLLALFFWGIDATILRSHS